MFVTIKQFEGGLNGKELPPEVFLNEEMNPEEGSAEERKQA